MSAKKALCFDAHRWMKENAKLGRAGYDKDMFARFTGQDFAAFDTFVHGLDLYAYSDPEGQHYALLAMKYSLLAMQPKCREIARRAIPHQFDWNTHEQLWPKIMAATPADVEVAQKQRARWTVDDSDFRSGDDIAPSVPSVAKTGAA